MIVLHRGTDPIGDWRFSSHKVLPSTATHRQQLAWAISHLPAALRVLQESKLLIPERVVVHLPETRPAAAPRWIQSEATSWEDALAVLDEIGRDWPDVVPISVDLQGTGMIMDGGVERWMPDVVGLRAYELGLRGNVWIATWCDAWLPYDMHGRLQLETRARNAPRLTQALLRIEALIGFTAIPGESKFSEVDGYTLTNRLDSDDEPIEMSILGYDDSWVAVEYKPEIHHAAWTSVPDAKRSRWNELFATSPHGCVDVAGACPVCGEAQLHRHYQLGRSLARVIDGEYYISEGRVWEWCSGCRTYEHGTALVPLWWNYYLHLDIEPDQLTATPDALEEAVQRRRARFHEPRQVPVVELRSFDGTTEEIVARFVLTTTGQVVTIARTEHTRQVADKSVARVPGGRNTWLTRDDGLAFLEELPPNLRGSRIFATKVFEMDETAALTLPRP